jgi:hypothetical protein
MTSFITILFILALVVIFIFRVRYNSPQSIGQRGEARVGNLLDELPQGYYVMNDIILKTERGSTQIDHVVVSKYGLFVIETKNYRGEIYGDDNRQQWTQIIATDVRYARKWYKTYTYITKNHFYNPVKQSLGHLYEIRKNLPERPFLKIIPIVVFTGDADLSKVQTSSHVIYDDALLTTIQQYKEELISDSEVQTIVTYLSNNNVREEIDIDTHIHNIKSAEQKRHKQIESGICPRCGGKLVLRNGRYGQFYGCSNYPKCRFTHPAE